MQTKQMKSLGLHSIFSAILFASGAGCTLSGQAKSFDDVLLPHFPRDQPGAAVIVVKSGKVLFRKAYGMADVERGIPMQPESVLRLGSLTKQFTAVAIMLLVDEGKIALEDSITKFLPDYPTHEKRITIENLLTHTSGIKSDTELPGFVEHMAEDRSVNELIDFIKNEPLSFDPGTSFCYSNSGYVILGAIIERVSGKPYHAFMAERIFEPLGMRHTAYEGFERDGQHRVEGYNHDKKAAPISMTQPYAAGGLVSTVDDLAIWDAAISEGKLLRQESWARIFRPYVLPDGKSTNYAFGWMIGNVDGRMTEEHGGGIPGFASYTLRIPEEQIYVAILTNNDGFNLLDLVGNRIYGSDPASLAARLSTMALKRDRESP